MPAIEPAVPLGPHARDVVRYVHGVDLVALARLAPCPDIPLMYERYTRAHGDVALSSFLACLSLLVARGIVRERGTL